MTEDDIRKLTLFIRSRQPRFYIEKEEHSLKVEEESHYYCNLYDRRKELLPGSKAYEYLMDEIYVKEAIRYFNEDSN